MIRTPTHTTFSSKDEIKKHLNLLNKQNQKTIAMLIDTLDLNDINFIAQFSTSAFEMLSEKNIENYKRQKKSKTQLIDRFNRKGSHRLKYIKTISNLRDKYPHITRIQLLPVLLSGENGRQNADKANKDGLKMLCKARIIDKATTYIKDPTHIEEIIEEITEHFGNDIRNLEGLYNTLWHNIKVQANRLRDKDNEISYLPTSHISYKTRAQKLDEKTKSGGILEKKIDEVIEKYNLEKVYIK